MIGRKVSTRQRALLVVSSFLLAMRCGLAYAQDALKIAKNLPPPANFYDVCPSGHRLEFQIGSLALYIDPHWLAIESEVPLWRRFGPKCPSEPITISKLYFDNSILDAAKIPGGLGQPFFFLVIRDEATLSPKRMTKLGLRDTPPLKQTEQPYVEDITSFAFRVTRLPPQSPRVYRVVYPGVGNKPPTFVEVSCGGDPSRPNTPGPGRTCFTPIAYSYLGTFTVDYKFRQDRLPIAEAEKDPPTMLEPEGVLAFDSHLRAWLDSLTKKK